MLKTLKSFDYHTELIETLLKAKAGAFAANVLAPVLFLLILHAKVPTNILYVVTFAQIITFVIRMVIADRTLKIIPLGDKVCIDKHLKYYLLMIFINAFLLGLSSVLAAVYVSELYMIILIAMIFGVVSGAMATLTPVYHAIFIFITVALSTVIFGLLFIGTSTLYYGIALLLFLYMIISLPASLRIYSSMNNSLQQKIELENKNSNFQNLLDITMEAIIISDENRKIVDINQSGVYLFNFKDKSEALGKKLIEFVPKYELPKLQEGMKQEIAEPYEIDLQKTNGEIFPTFTSGRNMMIDGKKVRISTILDLSQIKQKDQLLVQQSRQAAMGEMIGNIAHQWRQPLNALGLVLQNIQFTYQMDELSDEFMDNSVEKGKELTQSMSKTIDDFRDFFKPNKLKEHFKISDAINSAIGLMEGSFKDSNIEIKTNLDESISFNGYPSEFSQVVLNILSNAKDALMEYKTEERVVEVHSYLDGISAIVTISDNAGGISAEVIEKVFNPYFTTKEEGKGTGIGLYMSKTIVENNMGGKLSVSNENGGAKFTITFA